MNVQRKLLEEAYTVENLNKICSQIILLFRFKQYFRMRALLRIIGNPEAETMSDKKLLTSLTKQYHPDLLSSYKQVLETADESNYAQIAHILKIQSCKELFGSEDDRMDTVETEASIFEEETVWESGYDTNEDNIDYEAEDLYDIYCDNDPERSLYYAFKISVYGRVDIELPVSLLEDISEIELSNRGIEHLAGVEYFHQLVRLDISNNQLSNLEGLEGLELLEELYANDNEIGYIDALVNMENLRFIDLSGNNIDDISILLEFPNLEYVDLTNNPIPEKQLVLLKAKVALVIY